MHINQSQTDVQDTCTNCLSNSYQLGRKTLEFVSSSQKEQLKQDYIEFFDFSLTCTVAKALLLRRIIHDMEVFKLDLLS